MQLDVSLQVLLKLYWERVSLCASTSFIKIKKNSIDADPDRCASAMFANIMHV